MASSPKVRTLWFPRIPRRFGAGGASALTTLTALGAAAGCASIPIFGPTPPLASREPPEEVPLRIVARAPAAPLEVPSAVPTVSGPHASAAPDALRSSLGADHGETSEPALEAEERSAHLEPEIGLSQVSFAAEGGDFAPVLDGKAEFMVFASTQHRQTFDLYRKSVHGRAITLLTDDPSDDMMPAISPDGTRLAFASNRNGNWDVFTMPIDGGPAVQVTSEPEDETHPTWAPDGRRLALSRRNGRTGGWEIWVVDAENPGVRTYLCEGFQPRWSPDVDRDRLLFQRARQRGSRLYGLWTIDLVAGEARNPTEVMSARNAAVVQPAWSPDGRRIVFATVVDPEVAGEWPERSQLWTVEADGSGRTAIADGGFRNMQPTWASDGRIYFASNRSGVENVWAVPDGRSTGRARPEPRSARAAAAATSEP